MGLPPDVKMLRGPGDAGGPGRVCDQRLRRAWCGSGPASRARAARILSVSRRRRRWRFLPVTLERERRLVWSTALRVDFLEAMHGQFDRIGPRL